MQIRTILRTALLTTTISAAGIVHADLQTANAPAECLGPALADLRPDLPAPTGTPPPFTSTGGFDVSPTNRQMSRAFFNSVFNASEAVSEGWTGDHAACDPGTNAVDFIDATMTRVNYYRAMAGMPSAISNNATFSHDAQETALMMSKANPIDTPALILSHYPTNGWPCWTAEGSNAASKANLSLGNTGAAAVTSQMRDNGGSNDLVGHRRWILYPQTQEMGSGNVPFANSYYSAAVLYNRDSHGGDPRPATREPYVAWPPPGYVPYSVVFPRWSFSWLDADFTSATVTMTSSNGPVAVVQETVGPTPPYYIGEASLVWVPEGLDADEYSTVWPNPGSDMTYTVQVSNVMIDGSPSNFTYTVTVMDPATAPPDEPVTSISGTNQAAIGSDTLYTFNALSFCTSYNARAAAVTDYTYIEGAESGYTYVIDNTDAGYDLIQTSVKASGTSAFHLCHANSNFIARFTLDRTIIPGTNSVLSFASRLGWATSDQFGRAQVSTDDGASWNTIYEQAGTGGAGESALTNRSIDISSLAGSSVRIRFSYDYQGGSFFYQSSAGVGFYIDDIAVSHAREPGAFSETNLVNTSSFFFSPSSTNEYLLQVRAEPWPGFPGLDWGPVFFVTGIHDADGDGIDDATDPDDDNDGMPDDWETAYGMNPTNSSGDADSDTDGATDFNEYTAGTDPTNPASFFSIADFAPTNAADWALSFYGVSNHLYTVNWSTDLSDTNWGTVQSNIPGSNRLIYIQDSTENAFRFYRIRVRRNP